MVSNNINNGSVLCRLRLCENEGAAADETNWNLAFYYLHVKHQNVCLQKKACSNYFQRLKKSRFCNIVKMQ